MKITFNEIEYDVSDEWSFKNFTNMPVPDLPNDIVIYSTLFYHETPDYEPFPPKLNGVTFIKCNLDNIIVPDENTIIECSQKRFEAQNDGNDWLINEDDDPTLPINHEIFTKFDLPMPDPENIPDEQVDAPIDLVAGAREEAEMREKL